MVWLLSLKDLYTNSYLYLINLWLCFPYFYYLVKKYLIFYRALFLTEIILLEIHKKIDNSSGLKPSLSRNPLIFTFYFVSYILPVIY